MPEDWRRLDGWVGEEGAASNRRESVLVVQLQVNLPASTLGTRDTRAAMDEANALFSYDDVFPDFW